MKRLKLRKEVKVITTLLSFGLLCTAVPTINAVAEDTGTEENTVETNTVDETTTDETVIDDDAVVEEQVVEEVESPESDLYTRLMSTQSIEELEIVFESYADDEISLLSDNQTKSLSLHIESLEEQVTGKPFESNDDDIQYDSPIILPTVNYSNVAPLVVPTSLN